ncbi:MAG: hypothetical protein QXH80_00740 [Candidatus Nanoarchaeia archaeon]
MSDEIEHPQVIVYILLVMVLTLSGMYVSFTKLGGVDITFKFQDYASRLNTVSGRLMLTPECYAVENNYSKEGTHYQVSAGTIDWVRFNSSNIIDSKCLSNEKQVWVHLQYTDKTVADTIWSCPGQTSCPEPKAEELSDSKKWVQVSRSYFVLIQNNTDIDKGIMTVRLKA